MIARPLALALTSALTLVAAAATWFVFAAHAVDPPAGPPPSYLQAKGDALFNASFKPVGMAGAPLPALRGKPVIGHFWPSWCVECAVEVKALQAVQDQHAGDGLVVLGFGVDQADRIERFARTNGVGFAVFAGGQAAIDLSKKMGNLREGMPFVVAVDRQGRAVASHLGRFGPQTAQDMAASALR